MDKPKNPCRSDCEYRSANCHNETCPYGWAEYEKQKAIFLDHIQREQDWYYATMPLTEARKRIGHRNILKKKRDGKL